MKGAVYAAAGAAILALALQFQPTFSLFGLPVRLSPADIAVLVLLPLCGFLAWREGRLPQWRAQPRAVLILVLLLAAAELVMTAGFLAGAADLGRFGQWALVKFAGWHLLLCYAALGLLLVCLAPRKAPELFVRAFVGLLALTVAAALVLTCFGVYWPRLDGFVANPNAFALLLLIGIALALSLADAERPLFRPGGWEALAALLCAGVLMTGSLAASAAMLAVAGVWLALRWRFAGLCRVGGLVALFYLAPLWINRIAAGAFPGTVKAQQHFGVADKLDMIVSPASGTAQIVSEITFGARLESCLQAISLWREQPIFGIGLGGFWERDQVMIIHSTPIWLLTEFGLAGFAVFAGLFVLFALCLAHAMREARKGSTEARFLFAGLAVLAAWVVMGQAHEMMYQRAPWLTLGLCAGFLICRPGETSSDTALRPAQPP